MALLTTCSSPNVQAVDDKPEDEDEKTVGARLLPGSCRRLSTRQTRPLPRRATDRKSHTSRGLHAQVPPILSSRPRRGMGGIGNDIRMTAEWIAGDSGHVTVKQLAPG